MLIVVSIAKKAGGMKSQSEEVSDAEDQEEAAVQIVELMQVAGNCM